MFRRLIECLLVFGYSGLFIVVAHAVPSVSLVAGEGTLLFVFTFTSVFKSVSTCVKLYYFSNQKSTNQKHTFSPVK